LLSIISKKVYQGQDSNKENYQLFSHELLTVPDGASAVEGVRNPMGLTMRRLEAFTPKS
jgi:hypothetical protein